MARTHDPAKQLEALAQIIFRYAEKKHDALTLEQATIAAEAINDTFDLAGKGTLDAFKDWVLDMQAAGPYMNEGGGDPQAQNCAARICC